MEFLDGKLEVKSVKDEGTFSGYASVFGNVDRGSDVVTRSAFDRSIKMMESGESRPKMLWQHNPDFPIGVWTGMSKDERGLKVDGRISLKSAKGAEVHALLQDGAIDSMSIGYRTLDSEIVKNDKGQKVRHLKDVELWEVSLVTFPMNAEALVTDVKQLEHRRDVEYILRKAGVPGAFAKLVAAHGYDEAEKLLNSRRDGGDDADDELQRELLTQLQGLKGAFHA